MPRLLRPVPVLAAALLASHAAAATAAAAPPWSGPQPIRHGSTSPVLAGAPALTTNVRNLAVAVADAGGVSRNGPHTRASVFTNGVFLDPFTLSGPGVAFGPANGQVAAYAQTRLLAAGLHHRASGRRQAVFSFGRLTANRAALEGRLRTLGPGDLHAQAPALAVNGAGDAAMAYAVCRNAACSRALIYLAVRRAGSSTIRSVRLADGSGPLPRVAAAVNARGDALAVWSQASTLYARVRTAGGRVRPRRRVGATVRGQHLAPSAALTLHRAELVGWVAQAVSEGDTGGDTAFAAKARDGGAFTATALSTLPSGTGNYVSEAGVRVAFDVHGRSLVAYTAFADDHFLVRHAQVEGAAARGDQRLADVQAISDAAADTVLSDLVVGPQGGELVLMLGGVRGHDPSPGSDGASIRAASRAPNATGAFTREEIAPAQTDASRAPFAVDGARLADGTALAAWTTTSQGDVFARRTTALP